MRSPGRYHAKNCKTGHCDARPRRLERLARSFMGQSVSGQPAQLVVDQRQEFGRGVRIGSIDAVKQIGHIGHWASLGECPADPPPDRSGVGWLKNAVLATDWAA